MKKLFIVLLLLDTAAFATTVRFETNAGNIDIELYDDETPSHVANFLNYVYDGDYDGTVIHRLSPGFVLQGGGYRFENGDFVPIPTDPKINSEKGISNVRGTIALAKAGNNPSGDSQWFFNLQDNLILNTKDGGFTVFGKVTDETMFVVDLISSLGYVNETPVVNFKGFPFLAEHLIYVKKAYVLDGGEFKVNAGISGGWYNPETTGQGFYFEMLPQANTLLAAWFTYDMFQPEDDTMSVLGHPGHRWFTSQGTFEGNVFSQPIAVTQNGLFDSVTPVESHADGTLTIEFSSCTEAEVTYAFDTDNVMGVFPITRLSGDNVALCEQLSGQAQQTNQ